MSGYIQNNKKRILNDHRSRIRFHFRTISRTARCRHGYRSVLCCERPPAPDHHPWVPRRSIRSARGEWLNHYQQSMCSCFLFFIFSYQTYCIDWIFVIYIYFFSLYISQHESIYVFFGNLKHIFFDLCFIHFDSCLFYFWKTDKHPPDGSFNMTVTAYNWLTPLTLPMTPSKPVFGEILKTPYRIKTKHRSNFYDALNMFFPCLICIFILSK